MISTLNEYHHVALLFIYRFESFTVKAFNICIGLHLFFALDCSDRSQDFGIIMLHLSSPRFKTLLYVVINILYGKELCCQPLSSQ